MKTLKITGTVYARPETHYWDRATLDEYGIAEVFCLYVIPHDGQGTVDTANTADRNVFEFFHETPEWLREKACEALEREGIEETTLFWSEIYAADARLKTTISVEEEVDEDEEIHPWYLADRLYASYCENPSEPDILDRNVWVQWRAEALEKRRARNLPPIANWGANGLDNLPLFAHAANQIMAPRAAIVRRAVERYGYCVAHRLEKKPLEKLRWSWSL